MSKLGRKAVDDLKIMEIYNSSGSDEAKGYLSSEKQIKYPRCVISRLKRNINNRYDKENDKFLILEESPFLELDELYIKSNNEPKTAYSEPIINKGISNELVIEDELQQMLQLLAIEKLLAMTKHISLNQATRQCIINKNSLELAGYKVEIN